MWDSARKKINYSIQYIPIIVVQCNAMVWIKHSHKPRRLAYQLGNIANSVTNSKIAFNYKLKKRKVSICFSTRPPKLDLQAGRSPNGRRFNERETTRPEPEAGRALYIRTSGGLSKSPSIGKGFLTQSLINTLKAARGERKKNIPMNVSRRQLLLTIDGLSAVLWNKIAPVV